MKPEIKSQIIWYKPSQRPKYADPLLRMHVRCCRKAGWTPIQLASHTQSIKGWDVMMWHLTLVGKMFKKDSCPRRRGSNKGRDVEDEGPLSSHAYLSLFFSFLNLISLLFYSLLSSMVEILSIYKWFSWSNERRTLYSNQIWVGPILMKEDSYKRYNCHDLWHPLCIHSHTHLGRPK